MKTSEVLVKALELLGPNGENWIKFNMYDANGGCCAIGAIRNAGMHDYNALGLPIQSAHIALESALPKGWALVRQFNDCNKFADVKALFERAIEAERAKEAAGEREAGVY